jgi:peptidoglycan/LPS O-acetylase OafA/YrhL
MLDSPVLTRRSPAIDLMRAGLATWVVLSHLIPWTAIVQGAGAIPQFTTDAMNALVRFFQPNGELHPAVVCFIVLSGYCIHRAGLRRSQTDVRAYGIRRFFRIYPVYALATVFGIAAFLVAGRVSATMVQLLSGTQAITAQCVAAKLSLVNAVDPYGYVCSYVGNAPLATVMVEMCLYILYPILLLQVAARFGERVLWALVGGVFVVGVAVVTVKPHFGDWWQNASLFSFLIYWWIGAKLLDAGFARMLSRYWWAVAIAWGALSLVTVMGISEVVVWGELRKVAFGLLFGILVVNVDAKGYSLPRALQLFGQAGYSIYAFHAPLVYALLIFGVPWWLVVVAVVAFSLSAYALIERPGIRAGKALALRVGHRTPAAIPYSVEVREGS